MRHRQIISQGYLTIALTYTGRLYMQNGLTPTFLPLAPPPQPLTQFAIAPAGLVGTGKASASPGTWILPFDIHTGRPSEQWQPLSLPHCREMDGNEFGWAGIADDQRIYTGCFNLQNPTQVKMLSPLNMPRKLTITKFGILVASGALTYWSQMSGGMGNYGPWQKAKP